MIQKIKISKIKPNPNNPRTIKDEAFGKLVKSVKEFSEMLELRPIVVNSDMIILGGNMRYRACKEAGLKEVSIIIAENLTEEQQKEFLIKDNVSGGEWDWDMLANEWDNEEVLEWGLIIRDFETSEVLEAEEDDFDATPPEEHITVLGDLYEIGEHRLLCGNSTDSDQVAKLMKGQKAALCVTDPPYGIGLKYVGVMANNSNGEIHGDTDSFNPSCIFCLNANEYYIFGADYFIEKLPTRKGLCIWAKAHTEKENLVFGASFETFWRSAKDKREIWFENRIGNLSENLHSHPTQKPISLISRCINDSNETGIIVDIFLGTGSTMVASHQLKRKCYGMELDPKYCDVIVNRMIKLDPTLTIKRNGVDVTNDWK